MKLAARYFNKHTDKVIEFMNEQFWFRQWVFKFPLEDLNSFKLFQLEV